MPQRPLKSSRHSDRHRCKHAGATGLDLIGGSLVSCVPSVRIIPRRSGNENGFRQAWTDCPCGCLGGILAAIALSNHNQSVGQPGYAKTDPALRMGFVALPGQWIARYVDRVVQHSDGQAGETVQLCQVNLRVWRKGAVDELGEV